MNLGQVHKTRFWYLIGEFSKFSDEYHRHFYRGAPPGQCIYRLRVCVLTLVSSKYAKSLFTGVLLYWDPELGCLPTNQVLYCNWRKQDQK